MSKGRCLGDGRWYVIKGQTERDMTLGKRTTLFIDHCSLERSVGLAVDVLKWCNFSTTCFFTMQQKCFLVSNIHYMIIIAFIKSCLN